MPFSESENVKALQFDFSRPKGLRAVRPAEGL